MTPTHHRDTARDMVFGIGITLCLFAGAVTMPVIGAVGTFLLPLPVLIYRLKLGRAKGAAVAAIAFAAMAAILGGGSLDLFLFLALLVLGFVLGESFERDFSLEKTMLVASGGLTLAGLLILFFYSRSVGVGIADLISAYVDKNLAVFYEQALQQMGGTEEAKQSFSTYIELAQYIMLRILPGIAVSGILFTAWINLLLARPVLKMAGLPSPEFGSLTRWRAPEMLVWVLIGCFLLLLVPVAGLKLIGMNGLLVMLQIYYFQGIAIVSFFFEKKQIPLVLRWILYLLTLQAFLLVLVISLGLFDMWLNIRKIESNPGD